MPKKAATSKKSSTVKKSSSKKASSTKAVSKAAQSPGLAEATGSVLMLGDLRPNKGSRPKRTRVGRGHGSGMVKTGGEGGKGQTVRSGGGKGPAFEGGQTPWARRLPHRRGYSQKARNIGHFRTKYAVVNLADLCDWDVALEVTPDTLKDRGKIGDLRDGVKVLGGAKPGKSLPSGLVFRDVLFSTSAREALTAAGARLEESGA